MEKNLIFSDKIHKAFMRRFLVLLAKSTINSLLLFFYFLSLFLLFPKIFLVLNISSLATVIIFYLIIFFSLLPYYIHKNPLFGKKFFDQIVLKPYNAVDIASSKSLSSKFAKLNLPNSYSNFFANNYLKSVSNNISYDSFYRLSKIHLYSSIFFVLIIFFRFTLLIDTTFALVNKIHPRLIVTRQAADLEFIEAILKPPSYIKDTYLEEKVNLLAKTKISLLKGGTINVKGKIISNKLLSSELLFSTQGNLSIIPVNFDESGNFESSFLAFDNSMFTIEFKSIVGNKKFYSKSKLYKINILEDKVPSIIIESPEENFKTSFGSEVPLNLIIEDDYGISEINIYHRTYGTMDVFNKTLIQRYRSGSNKLYKDTFRWNPVIRAGIKVNELIYAPSTKKIEYYIEAVDNNTFSNSGVTKSKTQYINFVDILSDLKSLEGIIENIITKSESFKTTLSDSQKVKESNFKNFLSENVDLLNKNKNSFDTSAVVEKTKILVNKIDTNQDLNKILDSYIEFLKNFLDLIKLFKQAEKSKLVDSEIDAVNNLLEQGKYDTGFERMKNLFKYLESEDKEKLKKIEEHIKNGELTEAKKLMEEFLKEFKENNKNQYQESKKNIMAMSEKALKQIEKLLTLTKKLLEDEILEKDLTFTASKITSLVKDQKKINIGLSTLNIETEILSSTFPMINPNLQTLSIKALESGNKSFSLLLDENRQEALLAETMVIMYLNEYLKILEKQEKMFKQMGKGNMDKILNSQSRNSFVFIPKEALYTIPIDFKKKVIESSKNKTGDFSTKQNYWRDLIE